ncbi:uncharacterized protein ASCRUDRAFT_152628 [Ascoidea rubescens DSM 1968]|uniref:Uncharacterized protein n=1 Tax=Ascoidea rubescens DSM 1968 TaxID=1344418 RepID=A0A1D2VGY8_9ASCO|nr:hypothetical protein ASCRUDRAFT_152628 [Ascoidea rubescens DSM 1968]ODV60931.1 hypothetical protein ASCRUDRAFT_152628 [Ascoidea rubescens DSM 1968]
MLTNVWHLETLGINISIAHFSRFLKRFFHKSPISCYYLFSLYQLSIIEFQIEIFLFSIVMMQLFWLEHEKNMTNRWKMFELTRSRLNLFNTKLAWICWFFW